MRWRRFLSKKRLIVVGLIFLSLALCFNFLLIFCVFAGVSKSTIAEWIPFGVKEEIKSQVRWVRNLPYLFYKFKSSDLPVYNLYINQKDWDQLNENLPEKGEILDEEHKKYQPAKFIFDGEEYDVDVRYRGSQETHWLYPKKSWRIKFSKEKLFNGMRAISLTLPVDREFVAESLNGYRAEKLGLLAPFSGFKTLEINGKPQGVYLEYEHWGSEFLEKNQLSGDANLYGEASPNFEVFDETFFWKKYNNDSVNTIDNFAEIDKLLTLLNDSPDEKFYTQIFNLIDEENFYNWQLHSMLAGSTHQDNTHNLRIYFNNVIGKFQFIPWDVSVDETETPGLTLRAVGYNRLVERILKNPEFLLKRNEVVWDYVKDDSNLKNDLEFYNNRSEKIKISFYNDTIKGYSNKFFNDRVIALRGAVVNNFKYTRKILKQFEATAKIHLNFLNNNNKIVAIDLGIESFVPIELSGVELFNIEPQDKHNLLVYYDKNKDGLWSAGDTYVDKFVYDQDLEKYILSDLNFLLNNELEIVEEVSRFRALLNPIKANHRLFLIPEKTRTMSFKNIEIDIELVNHVAKNKEKPEILYADEETFYYFDRISESVDEFLIRHPFFVKTGDQKIALYPGAHTINENIIVPKNLELKIKPGAILYFGEGISFVSYGPVNAQGTKLSPIKFLPINPNKPWGVFGVVDVKEKSEFNNTIFEFGGDAYINGVYFSGMLALHGSDVEIKNAEFRNAMGDDALNVKYAEAFIDNSEFIQNGFDALDFDFVKGEISNSEFINNGNDGIDISGSNNLLIKENLIKSSGDKGISIGEESSPLVLGNIIEDCAMGIAVKDSSSPEIKNNKIGSNKVGIAAYQKKQIFGGAFPELWNTEFYNNEKDTETDELSQINFMSN